jgi:predicted thioredoxin/glutaredoxin
MVVLDFIQHSQDQTLHMLAVEVVEHTCRQQHQDLVALVVAGMVAVLEVLVEHQPQVLQTLAVEVVELLQEMVRQVVLVLSFFVIILMYYLYQHGHSQTLNNG